MASMHTFTFKSVGPLDLKLDVYIGKSATHEKPSFLYFHGGGLVSYDRKAIAPHIVQACLVRGWPLISPDYRLLPQATPEQLLEDVCDAYRFVDQQMWPLLGMKGRAESKGKIVVGGASAGGFLAIFCGTHMTPTPSAIFDIYGIPTFQSPFYQSNTSYPPEPIHLSQIQQHLHGPVTTGSTPPSETFTLDCLLDDYSKNPNYSLVEEGKEGGNVAKVTTEGLELFDRPYLYDYFVQEAFYAKIFKEIEDSEAELKGKAWPKTIILHGDADADVPVNLTVEFAEKHGSDAVQLFIPKGKEHFYDGACFLGDPLLKEFEEAWKALDNIVRSK